VIDRFDATGVEEKPHAHGTGMAGAIASHRRLLGTAPGARLLAIRAFTTQAASSQSTTFNILKGLDHAVNNGVRIVNMSFAGPRDPTIERALAAAYDRGVVLIAAAGNAGPKSPPLFPAADKHVIAVTATDIDDKLFTGANRGNYIAVAAPGVDIGAGPGRHLPDDDRHVGRDRPCERHRRPDAGAQSEPHTRRGSPPPDGECQKARAE
jgi:subtilisin family serine protease